METQQKYIIGFITLLVLMSGVIYITFENVKIRVDDDKSTFYVLNDNNRFIVAGREYNSIFDGTSKLNRDKSTIEVYQEVINNTIKITRKTGYIRGPVIIDTYMFNGSNKDIELFPVSHTIEIFNATGFFYRYEVRDLRYKGKSMKLDRTDFEFGLNMKVVWDDGFRWANVYKSGILKVQYDILSDYVKFENRLFDPLSKEIFDGDKVSIESSKGSMEIVPHHITHSQYIYLNHTSDILEDNMSLMLCFNSSGAIPTMIDSKQEYILYTILLKNKTIDGKMIFFNETIKEVKSWKPIDNTFKKVDFGFNGKDLCYFNNNLIRKDTEYNLRIWLKLLGGNGKFDVHSYPVSYGEDIFTALKDGVVLTIDPTFNFNVGLITYYSFEDNLNDIATGVYNFTNSGMTYDASGKHNKAVISTSTTEGTLASGWGVRDTNFTFSFWAKTTGSGNDRYVFSTQPSNTLRFNFGYQGNGFRWIFGSTSANFNSLLDTTLGINDGIYHHIVITLDWKGGINSNVSLYIDGDYNQSVIHSITTGIADNVKYCLGEYCNPNPLNLGFDGSIDEFAYWNVPLTPDAILDLYNSGAGKFYPFTTTNTVPNKPTLNSPTNAVTGQSLNVNLNVTVTDDDDNIMNVSFWNNATLTQISTTQTSIANGSTTQVTWSGLSANTTYYWFANVTDGSLTNTSDVWSFTTSYTPTLEAYDTTPDNPTISDNLLFNITCSDLDSGDTITGYVQVYNGTSALGSIQSSVVSNNTNTLLYTLNSGNTTTGQTWTGEYWCGDGISNSSKSNDSVSIPVDISLSLEGFERNITAELGSIINITSVGAGTICIDVDHPQGGINVSCNTSLTQYDFNATYFRTNTDNESSFPLEFIYNYIIQSDYDIEQSNMFIVPVIPLTDKDFDTFIYATSVQEILLVRYSLLDWYNVPESLIELTADINRTDKETINYTIPVQCQNSTAFGPEEIVLAYYSLNDTGTDTMQWRLLCFNSSGSGIIINQSDSIPGISGNKLYESRIFWNNSDYNTKNHTFYIDVNEFDDVINLTINLTAISDWSFPTYIRVFINNSFSNNVGFLSNSSNNTILRFQDNSLSDSNDYNNKNTIGFKYISLPKNSNVTFGTIDITGSFFDYNNPFLGSDLDYKTTSSEVKSQLVINTRDSAFSCLVGEDLTTGQECINNEVGDSSINTELSFKLKANNNRFLRWNYSYVFDGQSSNNIDNFTLTTNIYNFSSSSWVQLKQDFNTSNGDVLCKINSIEQQLFEDLINDSEISLQIILNASDNTPSSGSFTSYIFPSFKPCDDKEIRSGYNELKLFGLVNSKYYYKGNPTDVWIEVGAIDGIREFEHSGILNSTNTTIDFSSAIKSVLLGCAASESESCLIPFYVFSDSTGTIKLDNINVNYISEKNPITLDNTLINNYLKSLDGFGTLPITIENTDEGIINISDIRYDYRGGNDTIEVKAHTPDYSTNLSRNITYYYSGWNWSLPNNINYVEFIPQRITSKDVSPYGQRSTTPIFNITALNYGGKDFNYSIYMNDSSTCVNLSASETKSTNNETQLVNGTWKSLSSLNYTLNDNFGIWMFADYGCDRNSWGLFNPQLTIRMCCIDCDVCDTTVNEE